MMQVWAITYDPATFTDDIYQSGLPLVSPDAQARIKRFFRREDACRCLIGRLLPRVLLRERGVAAKDMEFAVTQAGKPYITTQGIEPPVAYNVSHDNALVVMAYAPGEQDPPAFRVGVDIMKVELSKRETFTEFVKIFSEQLTARETRSVLSVPEDEGVRRFFWIWTMKEAYTKALGVGLGFDFSRIEYNVPEGILTIDGRVPMGWQMIAFEIDLGKDLYQGVAARFLGADVSTVIQPRSSQSAEWLAQFDGASFVRKAVNELN